MGDKVEDKIKKEEVFEVKDGRSTGRYTVYDKFLDEYSRYVGVYTVGVYNSLCRHANKSRKSWPSITKISQELHCGRDSVIRGIKYLEFWSLILKDRVGKRANNRYQVRDKKYWKPINIHSLKSFSEVYKIDFTSLSDRLQESLRSTSNSKEAQSKETQSKGNEKFNSPLPAPITPRQYAEGRKKLKQMKNNLIKSGVIRPEIKESKNKS